MFSLLNFFRTTKFSHVPNTLSFTFGILIGFNVGRRVEVWTAENIFYVCVLSGIFMLCEQIGNTVLKKRGGTK